MLSPTHLRVLAEVAERGSFSAAAEALDYTQSAVSKQVAALEREVGTQLVLRAVRPVRLTVAGEALVRHARSVLDGLATAAAEVEAIVALEAGRVRVGTFSSVGATLVVQAVAEFRVRHPGVELGLVEAGRDDLVARVRTGDLDVAAVFDFPALGLEVGDGLYARHLLDEPHDLVLHPRHPLAREERLEMADLRDEEWLFPTLSAQSPTQQLFVAACERAGYQPKVVFRINDCEMLQALVAAGVGVGFLPRLAVHPVHPGVVTRPVVDAPRRRILAIALHNVRDPAATAFLALLERYAAAYPALGEPARA